jgi:lipoprotein-anchoring transpeptidase ErfK/SrfK
MQSLWAQAVQPKGNAMKTSIKTWIAKSLAVAAVAAATMAHAQQSTARVIVVSLEDRKLALIEDGQVKKVYTVAVGKPSTPSPERSFTIQRCVANPTYHHKGKTVEPGPENPVGTRWMGLSKAGYGIHGTNEPKSIGKAASHGCIRMAKADLEEFYTLVAVGDQVEIVGTRNEQTARLFEPTPLPESNQPAQLAKTEPAAVTVVTSKESTQQKPAQDEPASVAVTAIASR